MYKFIFPSKNTWVSSGSNVVLNTIEHDQNFGKDQILELKKEFEDLSFKYQTRVLVQFDLTTISESVADVWLKEPTIVFLVPVSVSTLCPPVRYPTIVLKLPDDTFSPALEPIKVFCILVETEYPAPFPIATLCESVAVA